MSKFVEQFDMYMRAHQAFKAGRNAEGLSATLFLLANGIVKPNARELYELWESSVYGGHGSDELFLMILDLGLIPDILKDAKSGSFEILTEFVERVGSLEQDTKLGILKAV
jgi:hypothetical protein